MLISLGLPRKGSCDQLYWQHRSQNLSIIFVKGIKGPVDRLPAAVGWHSVGHSEDRQTRAMKKVNPAVVI